MKKRILLVNKSFETGGIQSSMINLANELSRYYHVDLFLFHPEGPLKNNLSSKIRIIEPTWKIRTLCMTWKDVLSTRNLKMLLFWLFCRISARVFDNRFCLWIAFKSQKKLGRYDLAIAYHHEQRKKTVTGGFARFVLNRVEAKEKISWIHYDAMSLDLDHSFNKKYYEKMDRIVGVSKSVANAFGKAFPDLIEKLDYCYNIVEYNEICDKALQKQEVPYKLGDFNCFSACRLTTEKALTRAIEAFEITLKEYPEIMWYIAGDGTERSVIETMIQKYHLENKVVLLGNLTNPYPYMKNCDLLINVSTHEAAPMVFSEARVLGVPVFCTKTLSAEEMLGNGVEDFICDNNIVSIRDKFFELMNNREWVQRAKLQKGAKKYDNAQVLEKFREWMI